MGRAVNNAGAVITSFTSVLLLSSANTMIISVVALVLFALISVAIYAYSTQLVISVKEPVSTEPAVNYKSRTEMYPNLPARCVCQGLHCTGTFQLSMKRPIQVQE